MGIRTLFSAGFIFAAMLVPELSAGEAASDNIAVAIVSTRVRPPVLTSAESGRVEVLVKHTARGDEVRIPVKIWRNKKPLAQVFTSALGPGEWETVVFPLSPVKDGRHRLRVCAGVPAQDGQDNCETVWYRVHTPGVPDLSILEKKRDE
ncbi:MAG: hypothetical protein GF333_06820 [Candidatus Omnitrophica bacterium]|nr:hypothetical protein [Candidatus Omnitrophota bacterium]